MTYRRSLWVLGEKHGARAFESIAVIILKFTFAVRRLWEMLFFLQVTPTMQQGVLDVFEENIVRQSGDFPIGKMFDVAEGNCWIDWRPCVFAPIATDAVKPMQTLGTG